VKQNINAIKVLSAEAVQEANSGHPGLPLGAATMAFTLWDRVMNHNPEDPDWINRDRFILSAGHGSALIYSLLHLYGYGLSLDDLKNFRQFDSKTPGHPEYGHTIGVETTTGPLGQGFANGVGMAMAEKHLASIFNEAGSPIIDHYTYVIVGDGCLMEGVAYESASLAGDLGLGKLIVLYDSNSITIEGSTDIAFNEDVKKRFEAMNWHVTSVKDGNDIPAIESALKAAKKEDRPSLIVVTTVIGDGAPGKEGTHGVHGSPLGEEVLSEMKKNMGWPEEKFTLPQEVVEYYETSRNRLIENSMKWRNIWEDYEETYPEKATMLENFMDGDVNILDLENLKENNKTTATRSASGEAINTIAALNKNFVGGSADLAPSNKTYMKDLGDFFKDSPQGRNLHFGVREHAMGAIANGISAYADKKITPAVGTFLSFSDFVKPSLRMSALMGLPVQYIFTHDSIGVGEDGPTHQPIEQFVSLRAIPNSYTFRPCDMVETVEAFQTGLAMKKAPSFYMLSRQNLDLVRTEFSEINKVASGGYVIYENKDKKTVELDAIIIATGSEVQIAIETAKKLNSEGKNISVVSMPCYELFMQQTEEYRNSILPKNITKRLVIEASSSMGLARLAGLDGKFLCIDEFGKSAKASDVYDYFNLNAEFAYNELNSML